MSSVSYDGSGGSYTGGTSGGGSYTGGTAPPSAYIPKGSSGTNYNEVLSKGTISQIDSLISEYGLQWYNSTSSNKNTYYGGKITELKNRKTEIQTLDAQAKKEHDAWLQAKEEHDAWLKKYDASKKGDESDNWNIDYIWKTADEWGEFSQFGGSGSGNYASVSSLEIVKFFQDGSANDWMAGGNLYDSPRAGGQLFNVTGDMNTVRFLGLQDKNYNAHLQRELNGMAELHKMLGVNAGSDGFSIL